MQAGLVAKDGGDTAEGGGGGQVGEKVLSMIKQISVNAADQLVPKVGEDTH